jgi:uncharacterized protein (TIGR02246 family)
MRLLFSLVLMLAACSGATQGKTTTTEGAGGDAAPQVAATRLAEQWRQAWETRSAEALAPLYSHDTDLVVVDQGATYLGWTAVETYLSTKSGAAKEIHLTLADVAPVALGSDGAVVNATLTREINDGVSSLTERGTLTLVVRSGADGTWVIVTEHYSYPPSVD